METGRDKQNDQSLGQSPPKGHRKIPGAANASGQTLSPEQAAFLSEVDAKETIAWSAPADLSDSEKLFAAKPHEISKEEVAAINSLPARASMMAPVSDLGGDVEEEADEAPDDAPAFNTMASPDLAPAPQFHPQNKKSTNPEKKITGPFEIHEDLPPLLDEKQLNQEAKERADLIRQGTGRLPVFTTSSTGDDLDKASKADFILRNRIGRGGQGEVWRAWQASLAREVAIKRVNIEGTDVVEFLKEAYTSAELDHPNIVPVYDLGRVQEGGAEKPLLAMKLLRGKPWNELIVEERQATPFVLEDYLARHLRILIDVIQAVSYAHSKGILHRDLKPHQVIVGEFGEVFLIDWGLAVSVVDEVPMAIRERIPKHNTLRTATNCTGTPAYMAPEQTEMKTDRLGLATDIYLLGAILFELVAGQPPHNRGSAQEAYFMAAMNEIHEIPNSSPEDLVELIHDCLATEPQDRPQSAQEVLGRIEDYLSGSSKRRESLQLTQQLMGSPLADVKNKAAYGTLTEQLNVLSRARALWAQNPLIDELEERTLLTFIEAALHEGDLALARAQADRLPPSPKREEAEKRIGAAEIAAARVARQRVVFAGAVAIMMIIVLVALYRAYEDRQLAQNNFLEMEDSAYLANIQIARATLDEGRTRDAQDALLSAPSAPRRWEWGYLIKRAQMVESGCRIPGAVVKRGLLTANMPTRFAPDWNAAFFIDDKNDFYTWQRLRARQIARKRPDGYGTISEMDLSPDGDQLVSITINSKNNSHSIEIHDLGEPITQIWKYEKESVFSFPVVANQNRGDAWEVTSVENTKVKGRPQLVAFIEKEEKGVSTVQVGFSHSEDKEFSPLLSYNVPANEKVLGLELDRSGRYLGLATRTGLYLCDTTQVEPIFQKIELEMPPRQLVLMGQGRRMVWLDEMGRLNTLKWSSDGVEENPEIITPPMLGNYGEAVMSLDASEEYLYVGDEMGRIRIIDALFWREVARFQAYQTPIIDIHHDSTGQRLLTISAIGEATVWNAPLLRENRTFVADNGAITAAELGPNRAHLAIGGANGEVSLWRVGPQRSTWADQEHTRPVRELRFLDGEKYIFSADDAGRLVRRDRLTGNVESDYDMPTTPFDSAVPLTGGLGEKYPPEHLATYAISGDEKHLAAGFHWMRKVFIIDLNRLAITGEIDLNGQPRALVFGPDNKKLYIAYERGTLFTWNWESQNSNLLDFYNPTDIIPPRVRALAISPAAGLLAVARADSRVYTFDLTTKMPRSITSGHVRALTDIEFSADGMRMLTGSRDRTARVFSTFDARELLSFTFHNDAVTDVGFSADQKAIFTASMDGSVQYREAANY